MPWSLKNFLIKRVAVVDSGDNPEAEVLLFKQQEINDKGGAYMKTFEELMKRHGSSWFGRRAFSVFSAVSR